MQTPSAGYNARSAKSLSKRLIRPLCIGLCAGVLGISAATHAERASMPNTTAVQISQEIAAPAVDLVLALDISGSMSGLIDSAKQRLWDVVNELGQAQPTPVLRVAVITFGKPGYGADSGFVRINQHLTTDLDAVNKSLFSFQTDGGDEYVARAIHTAINGLQWSTAPNASKVLFVAGNESAKQDPAFNLKAVTDMAKAQGLIVNAIFCGNANTNIAKGWASVAQMGGGMYAAIDQQAATVAQIATPMDKEIAKLNQELNSTYIAYGARGREKSANQRAQDTNSATMSESALVARTVTKASKLYKAESWDLVDALASGVKLEDIDKADLPAPLRELPAAEQEQQIAEQAAKRTELQEKIGQLGKDRADYLRQQAPSESKGLDDALKAGIQKAVAKQGLQLPSSTP